MTPEIYDEVSRIYKSKIIEAVVSISKRFTISKEEADRLLNMYLESPRLSETKDISFVDTLGPIGL